MMKRTIASNLRLALLGVTLAAAVLLTGTSAWAFTVSVTDASGSPVAGFRWIVEEDPNPVVVPGVPSATSSSVNIHHSYARVVQSGYSNSANATVNLPSDRAYLVSVLPDEGYTLGARQVTAGQAAVQVIVNAYEVPTAQVAVYVFHDHDPVNGAPDTPAEEPLDGFQIVLFDFLGQVSTDAFGNPLGTTYNADGSVAVMGDGEILTDANGEAIIKNLAPGKYGVRAIAPRDGNWIQTSTIEGTPGIDAWLRAGEPPYFMEFGVASWHVFIGFLHPQTLSRTTGVPVGRITGRAVWVHDARPPTIQLYNGAPVPNAWVALNNLSGADEQVYAQPCAADGSFDIRNVPPGTYQLVVWDLALDVIINFSTVVVPANGGTIALGDHAVNAWFGRLSGRVFSDANADGYPDAGEGGISGQVLNLRFPDATIFGSTVTNPAGQYSFNEVFPWFMWTILEVDYTRYRATGATVTVDDGGSLQPGQDLHPQPQPENGGLGWRTEVGPSLVEGITLFAGQHSVVDWGKKAYTGQDNGGISGVVSYASTRAEDDARLGVMDPWEPGVPRVQVSLYQDGNHDKTIDDVNGDAGVTLADVDNYPFDNFPGAEDIDRNGNQQFDAGDALQIVWTDSWDDNLPSGCPGEVQSVHGQPIVDCAETLRTWNQVRPAVFDGGFAFWSYFPGGIESGSQETAPLAPGYYIVETAPPPSYKIVKEEDKNVVFGNQFAPNPSLSLPPECVGDSHVVPTELSLFPGEPAALAGQTKPLCDKREVSLSPGQNAAANFFLFTDVPVSGRARGLMLNDIVTDFNLNSPQYGDKLGPAWVPISFRDYAGNEIARVYTDEWGRYDTLVPSSFTANVPSPSGYSPGVMQICVNNPGPIPDPQNPGEWIIDPWYDPRYSQSCGNMEYYPGKMTVSDTPILPIAAFTGAETRLDCEFVDGVPAIKQVDGPDGGPLIRSGTALLPSARTITIKSRGIVQVPNPFYDPNVPGSPTTVTRDFGFGATAGQVLLGSTVIKINSWSADGKTISATVPIGSATGELQVVRGDNGRRTTIGVTLNISESPVVRVAAGQSIQAALDSAPSGALILVAPGHYRENLVMYKKQRLQGYGAYSTFIDAPPLLPSDVAAWTAKVTALVDSGQIELIPGERANFFLETGSGVLVATKQGQFTSTKRARIDGFTISGAIQGGGIFVNAYARYLEIANNVIIGNQGTIGGGIRLGTPSLPNANNTGYLSSFNDHISIHHNDISTNGSIDNGGGLALNNGSDSYNVSDNWICGNYTLQYGAAISHHGLSLNGTIQRNKILFNQSTDEGAGIMIAGELPSAEGPVGLLTPGAGSVTINHNLIQGNLSGDDGAGIRTLMVNGQDVTRAPSNPSAWYAVRILSNMIVNNSSQDTGGGISLDDTAAVAIINNTIANNDSTGTGVDAFGNCIVNNPAGQTCPGAGPPNSSMPRIAGIASNAHSTGLRAAFAAPVRQTFSNPVLTNNIVYRNRSFWWDATANGGLGGLKPDAGAGQPAAYWDLGVYGLSSSTRLNPTYSVLTSTNGYAPTNSSANPALASPYFNENTALSGGVGNLVYIVFQPLTLSGNYHLLSTSSAISRGTATPLPLFPQLSRDYDQQVRPNGAIDVGADEYYSGALQPMALDIEDPLAALPVGVAGVPGFEEFLTMVGDFDQAVLTGELAADDVVQLEAMSTLDDGTDTGADADDDGADLAGTANNDEEGGCGA